MRDVTSSNFGILIAYVLPGLTALWGASEFSETLRSWLAADPTGLPTVGGFLYVTLGSVGAGMTVSTIRWLLIDGLHHLTGLKEPRWDFSQLATKVDAFDVLIRIHYQVYQFNSNMLIAITFAYVMRKTARGSGADIFGWEDVGWLMAAVVFFAGSRDTLTRYYARGERLLGDGNQDNSYEERERNSRLSHRFRRFDGDAEAKRFSRAATNSGKDVPRDRQIVRS